MRVELLSFLLIAGCSSGSGSPDGACRPSDPSCNQVPGDAGVASDAMARDALGDSAQDPPGDAAADACALWIDDAGVTQGCNRGGMGPGDRDDGGGSAAPPPPDAALDASELPFGASCWDNAQCASGVCFDYKVRGTFCTDRCMSNTDCPAPSPGCNGMGVCRMADATDGGDGG